MSTEVLETTGGLPAAHESWSLWKLIGFRFAFLFWVVSGYTGVELVLWVWPWLNKHVSAWWSWPIDRMTLWAGVYVFHLDGVAATQHPTGSGDTALSWISTACTLAVALSGCAVWSGISEWRGRRKEYYTLYAWLRLVLRFSLASALLTYGFIKVFPLQMPPPSVETLAETYGASSPMKLAWTFLGASTFYRIFAGLCEVIPGVLLFFRRTSTLGALGAAAVMLNVFMMNMGYDIPVKIYSFELMVMAVFLLLPDISALWRFFVQRREAGLTGVWVRKPERKALRCAAICLQVAVICNLLYGTAWSSWKRWEGGHSPLLGSWLVDEKTGALANEKWTTVKVPVSDELMVTDDGKPLWLSVTISAKDHTLEVFHEDESREKTGKPYATFHWDQENAGKLVLLGTWNGQPATLAMHRKDAPPSLLMTRGFHWVSEYPYNR